MTGAKLVNTTELQVGDVVLTHGMRCLVCSVRPAVHHHRPNVVVAETLVLNRAEVVAKGHVPAGYIKGGTWIVQGNDLALWSVVS